MGGVPAADSQAKIDEEYMSLMAELGEGPDSNSAPSNNMPVIPNIPRNNFSNLFDRPPQPPRPIMPAQPPQTTAPPPPPAPWSAAPPPLMSNPPVPGINAPMNPVLPPTTTHSNWNQQPGPPGDTMNNQPPIPGLWNPPPAPTNNFPNPAFGCFPSIPNLSLPPPPPPPN